MGHITAIIAEIQAGNTEHIATLYDRYRVDVTSIRVTPASDAIVLIEHKNFLREVLPIFYKKMDEYFIQMANAVAKGNAAEFATSSYECFNFFSKIKDTFLTLPTVPPSKLQVNEIPVMNKVRFTDYESEQHLQAIFCTHRFPVTSGDADTPIHFAAENAQTHILITLVTTLRKVLVDNNTALLHATLNIATRKNKNLPIHTALIAKKWDAAEILIMNGSYTQLLSKNNDGHTALSLAILNQKSHLIKLIIDKIKPHQDISYYLDTNMPDSSETVKAAMQPYINSPIHNNDSNTILHNFIKDFDNKSTHFSSLNSMLKNNEDINVQNDQGENPLHIAARHPNPGIVNCVVKNNTYSGTLRNFGSVLNSKVATTANIINAQNNNGETCLHIAATKTNLEAITSLCENGGDVLIKDKTGEIPIHKAVQFGNILTISTLLVYKSNITEINDKGENALHIAAKRKNYARYESGKIVVNSSQVADGFRVVLLNDKNSQAALNAVDLEGNTPIAVAINHSNPFVVFEILKFSPQQALKKNIYDQTLLHLAASQGEDAVGFIDLILNNISSKNDLINQVDCDGNTALHFACQTNNLSAVQALLAQNINIEVVNAAGQIADLLTTDKEIKEAIRIKRMTTLSDKGHAIIHIANSEKIKQVDKLNDYLGSLTKKMQKPDPNDQSHMNQIALLTNQFIQDVQAFGPENPSYLKNRVDSYLTSVAPHLEKLPCSATQRMLIGALIGLVVSAAIISIFVLTGGTGVVAGVFFDLFTSSKILELTLIEAAKVGAALIGPALGVGAFAAWTWRPASYTKAVAENAKEMVEPTALWNIQSRPFY